ncbi:MAG: WecB/TagA/CpsF family glycosyltransferase [Candidatus Omnitrophica bacterium]|nr:WecB/TagA/CpsF family glycosyltransferase [Candidatus Omnitrophota bacterium]
MSGENSSYPLAAPKSGALKILDLPLHPVTEEELLSYIKEVILQKKKALLPTLNIHAANYSFKYPWFRDFFNQAQLVYCDSDGIRWGVRMLGQKPPIKISLGRWVWRLAEYCHQNHLSLYFLGGRPGVPEEARRRVNARFPGIEIKGVHDNDFPKEGPGNEAMIREINRLKPDILIVGLGMPLQEKWIQENWQKIDAHVFMPAGSTIEFTAGRIKTSPDWMVRHELEWFFRMTQEPKRLFARHVIGNPLFFMRVFCERLRKK